MQTLTDRCCAKGTPERDCPTHAAKYEAKIRRVRARAYAAPTATERATILLDDCEMPSGDDIFDLILENQIVHYVWARCIDWVLWRQAHGKPVNRMGDKDDCPAAIDARYNAAREYSSNSSNWGTRTDVGLLSAGRTIEEWERTPEQAAELQRSNDLLVKILRLLEANA